MEQGFVQRRVVSEEAVLAEVLTVIADNGDHEWPLLPEARLEDPSDQPYPW